VFVVIMQFIVLVMIGFVVIIMILRLRFGGIQLKMIDVVFLVVPVTVLFIVLIEPLVRRWLFEKKEV